MRPNFVRRIGILGLVTMVLLAILGLGAVPLRNWLDQREVLHELRVQVADIEKRNYQFELHIDALNTDDEIERRAREGYNLVGPEEEAYAILPPPEKTVALPVIWPFTD